MVNAPQTNSLQVAIERAGGPAKVAAAFGITSQAVSQWTRTPLSRVPKLSTLTGIPPHELRPDIYPAPEDHPSKKENRNAV